MMHMVYNELHILLFLPLTGLCPRSAIVHNRLIFSSFEHSRQRVDTELLLEVAIVLVFCNFKNLVF